MELRTKLLGDTKIRYYLHGDEPKLLILAGTHGDEYRVIDCVKRAIKRYLGQLPSFIFIPEVSPSACRQKTRVNKDKVDVNRSFFEETEIEEARAVMKIVKGYCFDLAVSFHEDLHQKNFYLYDSGDYNGSIKLECLRGELRDFGVGLLDGVDDPNDSALGFRFNQGYGSFPKIKNNGTFWHWAKSNGIVRRMLTPEIPGKISSSQKEGVVLVLFRRLILG